MGYISLTALLRIIISAVFLISIIINTSHAALPKAVQADKYKLLISKYLKSENHQDALEYIAKLESLKAKFPTSIIFYKGESLYAIRSYDQSKEALEEYINRTGNHGKHYKEALEILGELEDDKWYYGQKNMYGTKLNRDIAQGRLYRVKNT